jgi:hypothetical protein
MNANFLKRYNSDSEKIVRTAIETLKTYKLARVSEILNLNSGTVHNWITGKSNLSPNRAVEILLHLQKIKPSQETSKAEKK